MVIKRNKQPVLNNLSASDRAIWQSYTVDVQPLTAYLNKYVDPLTPAFDQDKQPRLSKSVVMSAQNSASNRQFQLPPLVTEYLPAASTALALSTKKIKMPKAIDGRLDLHGLTQVEAYNAVLRFIDSHYQRYSQTLIIITGKGFMRSHDRDRPSLAENLPHWLNQSPLNHYVRAFTPAHINHGGRGAYYVYLK